MILEKTFESSWDCKEINSVSILKEIKPVYSSEGLKLKLKLQYYGHDAKSQLIGKDSDAGKVRRQKEKGAAEDEIVR